MNIKIVAIGKIKDPYLKEGINHYLLNIKKYADVRICEVDDAYIPTNPSQFDIVGASESEGKGFSNGLWKVDSGVAQPMVHGNRMYKRIFIRRKQ